jgi:hypothetical protein
VYQEVIPTLEYQAVTTSRLDHGAKSGTMQGNMGEAECLAPARLQWLRQESGDGVRTLPLSFLMTAQSGVTRAKWRIEPSAAMLKQILKC